MNANELMRHYSNHPRRVHHAKPPPVFAIKPSCFEGLALFERDNVMIAKLQKLFPGPTIRNRIEDTVERRGRSAIFKVHAKAMSDMVAEGATISEAAARFSSPERPLAPYYARRIIDSYRKANGIEQRVVEKRIRNVYGLSKVTMQRLPEIVELMKFRDKKTGLGYRPYRIAYLLGMHHSTLGAAVKYINENGLCD